MENLIEKKLLYLLNLNKLEYKFETSLLNLIINKNEFKLDIKIYHDNYNVLYIFSEEIILNNIVETINLFIDDYEKIEDIVYELIKQIKSISYKNNNIYLQKNLENLKKNFIEENKNIKLELFTINSYSEMLKDQILKLFNNENFDLEIYKLSKFMVTFKNLKEILIIKLNIIIEEDINKVPPKILVESNIKLKNDLLNKINNLNILNNKDAWSIKYSLYETINNIYNIINEYGELEDINCDEEQKIINDLNYLLGIIDCISENKLIKLFDKDFNCHIINKIYWKKGTGYGYNGNNEWDIEEYIKFNKNKSLKIIERINNLLDLKDIKKKYINDILTIILFYFRIEEIDKEIIIKFINKIDLNILEKFKDGDKLFNLLEIYCEENNIKLDKIDNKESFQNKINLSEYEMKFNKYKVRYINNFEKFYYNRDINLDSEKIYKLQKEFNILKRSLINKEESNIFFNINNKNISKMRFIISGPKNTPYEYGLYIFDMSIDKMYPKTPPLVNFINHGSKRFNPNLYDNGKVCLSLLGTWSGHKGESWNSNTSTFLQILISIQSQIFVDQPYFNEPGYERSINTEYGKKKSDEYNLNIIQYNIDHAINDLINNCKEEKCNYNECKDIILEYFNFNKNKILDLLDKSIENLKKNNKIDNFNKLEKSKNKFNELIN
jgi:ubiquitin-protein ligase